MREPDFWWREPGKAGPLAALLTPLAACYGAVAGARMAQRGVQAGVPVICVGNFTLGGSGKTPAAIMLAGMLTVAGEKPALLSRGYGGAVPGPVIVDPARHRAADVGDEPLLLARVATTIVSRDRVAGAAAARAAGASAIVMDDGLQNPSLEKDLTIAVVDSRRGVGNGKVFPAGPLRAPLAAQFARADAVLLVGEPGPARLAVAGAAAQGIPVFRSALEPDRTVVQALRQLQVLAFAGIGDPDKFFATLAAAGIDVRRRHAFPDHYRLTAQDAAGLIAEADDHGLLLLTTEKDRVRMAGDPALVALAGRTRTLPVALKIRDEAEFRTFVLKKLNR